MTGAVETGGLRVEAIPTPGHSDDGVAFVVNGELCFSGDTLFRDAVGGGPADVVRDVRHGAADDARPRAARAAGPHGRHDDRPGVGAEPVRPLLARARGGGRRRRAASAGWTASCSSSRPTTTARGSSSCGSTAARSGSSARPASSSAVESPDVRTRRDGHPSAGRPPRPEPATADDHDGRARSPSPSQSQAPQTARRPASRRRLPGACPPRRA